MIVAFAEELKQQKRWIVWKDDKMPYSAVTLSADDWTNPDNWTSLAEAYRVQREHGFSGVGFAISYPYCGIDIDHCLDESGRMEGYAFDIVNMIDSFAEYSQSGTGVHIYCKVHEQLKTLRKKEIEIYFSGRYFIATAKELDINQLEITDQTENVKKLLQIYGGDEKRNGGSDTIIAEIVEGERNNRMTGEIGRMLRYWSKETVRQMAYTLNSTICKPPLDQSEIDSILESLSKRDTTIVPLKGMTQTEPKPIEGKRNLDEKPYRGIVKAAGNYIPTGIETIDYAINDLSPGCVTLITGRMNSGKSAFVNQIIANAVNGNNKVFLVTGEGEQERIINAIYMCAIGKDRTFYDVVKINKRYHKEPKAFVLEALKAWHKGKLSMFNKYESEFETTEALFKMMEKEVKENGHNLVVMDNLMSLLTAKATEKNEAQADFMQRCHDIANLHKIHIILVLHPNKEYRKNEELDVEQISGTSDLYNKADNVIAVIREYREEKIEEGINGYMALLKNRYYPTLAKCELKYDSDTGMLLEIVDDRAKGYDIDWIKYIDISLAPSNIADMLREHNRSAWEETGNIITKEEADKIPF